jgi:hypothetical protein
VSVVGVGRVFLLVSVARGADEKKRLVKRVLDTTHHRPPPTVERLHDVADLGVELHVAALLLPEHDRVHEVEVEDRDHLLFGGLFFGGGCRAAGIFCGGGFLAVGVGLFVWECG